MSIQFRSLDRKDDRAAFSCGEPALDDWFHTRASQEQSKNVTRVFVVRDDQIGIVGFYSLSAFSIITADLPHEIAGKLPRFDTIPAVLLGRLARDLRVRVRVRVRVRGTGMGDLLMGDAIQRVISASREMGVYAIVVVAKNENAAAFYRSFGFLSFPSQPLRLFLPLVTAINSLVQASQI